MKQVSPSGWTEFERHDTLVTIAWRYERTLWFCARSGYSGDTDPVNPVESFEANSAEHPRLDSLLSSNRGDDSMWENCAKSARSMGLSRSVGDCATHV